MELNAKQPFYANVNLLGTNINTIKKNSQTLSDTNEDRTENTFMNCYQNASQGML